MAIQIRPATETDEPGMIALLYECGLMREGLDYGGGWTHPTLVAVDGARVVGLIQALMGHPYAVITECAVHPEYRGKTGRALYAALEQCLRAADVKAWGCCTTQDNPFEPWIRKMTGGEPGVPSYTYLKRLA